VTGADAVAFVVGLVAGMTLVALVLVVGASAVSRVFTRVVWG
jgi:hypothetical protein